MKSLFVGITCAVTVVAFAGLGLCIEAPQTGQAPKKAGVIEKIKKAYSDFKDRDKKKEVAKEADKPKVAQPKAVQPEETQPKEVQPRTVMYTEMTKEEMLSEIKDDLETLDEILDGMPALKAEKGKDGKIFYTYNGVKLDEMGKEELGGLFTKVSQSATRFRTERIERQLETGRRTQRLTEKAAPVTPVTPSGPASVSIPPSPPSVPKLPSQPAQPSIAKPQSLPPSAPSRVPSPPPPPPSTKR